MMKIALGSDHGGYQFKEEIKAYLTHAGYDVEDFGTDNPLSACDYPAVAYPVAKAVADGQADRGILICGTGIGIGIAANKVPGIRAALCHDTFSAKASRNHNDANILTMGQRVIGPGLALDIVKIWLEEDFHEGRHQRRVNGIVHIEEGGTFDA